MRTADEYKQKKLADMGEGPGRPETRMLRDVKPRRCQTWRTISDGAAPSSVADVKDVVTRICQRIAAGTHPRALQSLRLLVLVRALARGASQVRPDVGSQVTPRLLKRDSGGALKVPRPYRINWTPRNQRPHLLPKRDSGQKENCGGQGHSPKQDACAYQRSFNQNRFHICVLNVY